MNYLFDHKDAELVFKTPQGEVVQKISVGRIDWQQHTIDVIHMGSQYREHLPYGLPEITVRGFVQPQLTPLSDKDWAAVHGVVAAAGSVAKKAEADCIAIDIFRRAGWLTAQDARHLLGMDPLDYTATPTAVYVVDAPFTEQDWAAVNTIARDTLEAEDNMRVARIADDILDWLD